jgi:DNA-directed RNA polymerase specialized sigma24 family protein
MASDQSGRNPEVWILDRGEAAPDDCDLRLRAAAVRVWPKVEAFARRELSDSSLAGETSLVWDVWEQTLQSLSNTLRKRLRLKLIRDLDSYVFGAFAHRLREVLRKERTIEFVASNSELAELKQTQDWSWVAAFENSLELKAVVDEMDDWMKEVLYRRALDEPWDEISEDMGVTTNALKKRFFYHLKKIRNRILDANRTVSAMGCQLPRKSDLD